MHAQDSPTAYNKRSLPPHPTQANITTLGPLVLPISEQLLFFVNLVARKVGGQGWHRCGAPAQMASWADPSCLKLLMLAFILASLLKRAPLPGPLPTRPATGAAHEGSLLHPRLQARL